MFKVFRGDKVFKVFREIKVFKGMGIGGEEEGKLGEEILEEERKRRGRGRWRRGYFGKV